MLVHEVILRQEPGTGLVSEEEEKDGGRHGHGSQGIEGLQYSSYLLFLGSYLL